MPKHNKPWQDRSPATLEAVINSSPANRSFLQRAVVRYGLPVLAALYLAACTPATPTPTITPKPTMPAATATPRQTPTQTPYNTPTAAPAPLADLAFGNVKHTAGEWGKDYKDGKRNYRVKFDVSNLGNIGSGAFYVSALEQKLRFEGVEPGKALPATFNLKLPTGNNSIDVVIEAENKASEKGNNNNYSLKIDVPEPPFKLVFDAGTSEQKETSYNNALEGYRIVLGVYGIKEDDARMAVGVGSKGYTANFYFEGKHTVGGTTGFSDLYEDPKKERGTKHEMSHAINHTLFPTENNIEPWYNTFDEGSAKYASGEVEKSKLSNTVLREDNDSLKDYNWMKAIDYLISNPNKFWERIRFGGNAGHLTGQVLYLLLEREGLTPEKHTEALKILAETYKSPDTQTSKEMIQSAYEKAMSKDLNTLFDKWLEPGIKRFYARFYATPTPTPR